MIDIIAGVPKLKFCIYNFMFHKRKMDDKQILNEDLQLFLDSSNVPNELVEIIKLRTIVEEPFTRTDINNIIDHNGTGIIGVLYGYKHNCEIIFYNRVYRDERGIKFGVLNYTKFEDVEKYITFEVIKGLEYKVELSHFNLEYSTGWFSTSQARGIPIKTLYERLIGRFDLSIVNESNKVMYIGKIGKLPIGAKADVILLALPSLNWIYYKRFQRYGYKDPMKLAIKYTRQFFDSIVNSISDKFDLPLLFSYMILNVEAYGYNIDREDIKYINRDPKVLTDKYLSNIDKCCTKYYNRIMEYISYFK